MRHVAKAVHEAANLLSRAVAICHDAIRPAMVVRIGDENVRAHEVTATQAEIVYIGERFALPEATAAGVEGAELMEKPVRRNEGPPALV